MSQYQGFAVYKPYVIGIGKIHVYNKCLFIT